MSTNSTIRAHQARTIVLYTSPMKQVVIIHGGDSFSSYDAYIEHLKAKQIDYERLKLQQKWKPWIAQQLPDTDVLLPTFPNGYNAVYDEWCIYFEKLIPFLGNNAQLVGHSLGAMFLTKYLHENTLPVKIKRLVLIAGQYGIRQNDDLGSFVVKSAKNLDENANEIYLFYSKDDPVVDFNSIFAYLNDLPNATSRVFENRGHFIDDTFPELLKLLKQK